MKKWLLVLLLMAFYGSLLAQDELIPGLQNMGIFGGQVERIVPVRRDGTTTRLYASFQNPNSVFYADIDHTAGGNPFDPANEIRFRVVPGLASSENRPIPSHIAVHRASQRLFANTVEEYGHSISSFSVDPLDAVQEVFDLPPGGGDVNRSAWSGEVMVYNDDVVYTLAQNVDTNHTFLLCLRPLDPVTGMVDVSNRVTVVMHQEVLPSANEPSGGFGAELAVCPMREVLMAVFFAPDPHPLHGKLLVSKNTVDLIADTIDWTDAFDAYDLPAYVGGWQLDSARWPLRLGVGPDGRVFVAGLAGDPSTIRIGFSDDAGQTWSDEVDTGVQQGYLGPQIAFVEEGANYYVYSSSSVSTNKGASGSWFMTGYGMHAPAVDPLDTELLYYSADQMGLAYSTNALSTETYQDHNLQDWLELDFATYSYGIEAVEIYDFDFTVDKTVGWTVSGQGVRWTTNLNAAADQVVWSDPIMPEPAPSYHAVTIDPNVPGGSTVYAADNRNVYRSGNGFTDDPEDWVQVLRSGTYDPVDNPGGYEMSQIQRMVIRPGNSDIIVVGFRQSPYSDTDMNGVLYSEDYGVSWTNMLFHGEQRCDVRDLLYVDGQVYVAASYHPDYPGNSGVFRIDADDGWQVFHELDTPFNARSLAMDSEGNFYVAGLTTNATEYGYSGEPLVYWRPAGGSSWEPLTLEGLPESAQPGQPANAFVTVGVDGNGTEAVLMTFGRGLYVLRDEGWVRIFKYDYQTRLHVLLWDELTLGSGSGLYAQDTGDFDGNTFYVSLNGSHEEPFDSWGTAATNIQSALNLAGGGDRVLVTNGVYETGGMNVNGLMTRVVVPDWVTLESVNGPGTTVIKGAAGTGVNAPLGPDAVRGAYVGERGRLIGFTVTGGATDWMDPPNEEEEEEDDDDTWHLQGGGVYLYGGLAYNCIITNNTSMLGGGVCIDGGEDSLVTEGEVIHCRIQDNTAIWGGGGALILDSGLIVNCFILDNTAIWGAGVTIEEGGTLANSLVAGNQSTFYPGFEDETGHAGGVMLEGGGDVEGCTIVNNHSQRAGGKSLVFEIMDGGTGDPEPVGEVLNTIIWGNTNGDASAADIDPTAFSSVDFSCAPELTAGVDGNLNSDPVFVDFAGGNYRLDTASPCIDTGENQDWMGDAVDLGGRDRIINGTVDMGAYEYRASELGVAPRVRLIDSGATTISFDVVNLGDGEIAYEASESESWIAITSGATGDNAGTLVLDIDEHSGATTRMGTVTITAAGVLGSPTTLHIHQRPSVTPAELFVWGADSFGLHSVPAELTDVAYLNSGRGHILAVQAGGSVFAWGWNEYGQCNVPEGLSDVWSVAGGNSHSLALKTDGTVLGWGTDFNGLLDIPEGLNNVVAIATSGFHSLALRANGTVVAWGDDIAGSTVVPGGLTDVIAIAAGLNFSLALRANGTVAAWGSNYSGQTTLPEGLSGVVAIAAGDYHGLALKSDGTVVAWGYNNNGQTDVPEGLADAVAIAAGAGHNMALKSDGTVVAWGGQNGAGEINVPNGLSNVTMIAAGTSHSVAMGELTPVLSVLPEDREVLGDDPGTTSFIVENLGGGVLNYEAATADAWLEITAGATGALTAYTTSGNSATITVAFEANPNPVARTGTVTVTAIGVSGSPAQVQVVQEAGPSQAAWDAGYEDLEDNWRRLAWFGDYIPTSGGWFWHNRHGYFFPTDASTPDRIYLYTMDMGWLFTRQDRYPYLYRFSDRCWLWYQPDSQDPRWFYNLTQGVWEER